MSDSTLRLITGFVLIVHGIGHVMALLPALNIASSDRWNYRSWLLSGLIGDTASRILVIVLFGIPMVGFITAGMGLFGWIVPHSAWQTLALVSAVISLVGLGLFWNAFVSLFPNKIGALVVNIVTLWALLGSGSFPEAIQNL